MKWFRNSKKKEEEKYKKENLSEQKKQPNDDIKKENLVSITEKFELVKKEYNASVGDLMLSKKELTKIKAVLLRAKHIKTYQLYMIHNI